MKRFAVCAACLALCAGIAMAQKAKLESKPAKGLTLTTKTTMTVTLESDNAQTRQELAMIGDGIDIQMSTEEKVKEVAENGDITVSSTTKVTSMMMGGLDLMPMMAGRNEEITKGIPSETTRDRRGKILKQSSSEDGGGMVRGGALGGLSRMVGSRLNPLQGFPETELAVGDKWEVEVPINPAKPSDKAKIVVTVLSFETKDGVNLVKVKATTESAIKDAEALKLMSGGPMGEGTSEEITLKGDMMILVRTEDATPAQTEGIVVVKSKGKNASLTISTKLKSVTTR